MTKEELDKVLESHKKWLGRDWRGKRAVLNNEELRATILRVVNLQKAYLCGADLRDADLRDADFREAILIEADLRGADLRGANFSAANLNGADLCDADIDFSVWPLWCGGLFVHIDDRIAIQLLYHLVRNVLFSRNTSEELKRLLSQKEIVQVANQFHRVDECGRIEVTEQCQ